MWMKRCGPLKNAIEENGLLFLCEMGLDPGIDHMSAKKMIDEIHEEGGKIHSFLSHCGGLVAPESDDNPWHYKISWNPRNVVMAGKAGAIYKMNGEITELNYEDLFAEKRYVPVPGHEYYAGIPTVFFKLYTCVWFTGNGYVHPHHFAASRFYVWMEKCDRSEADG